MTLQRCFSLHRVNKYNQVMQVHPHRWSFAEQSVWGLIRRFQDWLGCFDIHGLFQRKLTLTVQRVADKFWGWWKRWETVIVTDRWHIEADLRDTRSGWKESTERITGGVWALLIRFNTSVCWSSYEANCRKVYLKTSESRSEKDHGVIRQDLKQLIEI